MELTSCCLRVVDSPVFCASASVHVKPINSRPFRTCTATQEYYLLAEPLNVATIMYQPSSVCDPFDCRVV